MTDDDIIRRRLLMDGEGMGDERRLNILLKNFTKWCMNTGETEEESKLAHEHLLGMLAQCEFYMKKSYLISEMQKQEMQNYDSSCKQIEKDVSDAQKRILECKRELQRAKRVRKNRQEYDALGKVIQMHPNRKETMKELKQLDDNLKSLQSKRQGIEKKLEMRKKQFHVLMTSIYELQKLLLEEEEVTEENRDSDKMDTT